MVREEAVTILRILKASYPHFYKGISKDDAIDIVELWSSMFDEPVEIVTEAVKAVIATKKDYPPTVADVKEKILLISTNGEQMTEFEAWNRVKQSISNYGAEHSFEDLPPILKRLVGSPQQLREWALMDIDTLNTVIQSNFMRSYKARAQTERDMIAMPDTTRRMIENIANKYSISEVRAYELCEPNRTIDENTGDEDHW